MTETTITTPSWVQALDKYVASKPIEDVAADLGLKPEESSCWSPTRTRTV